MILDVLRVTVHIIVLVIMAALLMESRFSKRKTLIIGFFACLFSVVSSSLVIILIEPDAFFTMFPFTMTIPLTVGLVFVSKHKLLPTVFNILTVCVCGMIDGLSAAIVSLTWFGGSSLAHLIFCILFYFPIVFIMIRVLKKPYREMNRLLDNRGWLMVCVPSILLFFAYSPLGLSLSPIEFRTAPYKMAITGILFLMQFAVYGIIYSFFLTTSKKETVEENNRLMEIQVLGLRAQAEAIRRQKKQAVIQNHDTRHYLGTVSTLLQKKQYDEAIAFLNSADTKLQETIHVRYCENTIIDAILTYYMEKAEAAGIRVDIRLDIPQTLPLGIDGIELASVFANALDNAIQACEKMSSGRQREIVFTALANPRVGFEIANTFDGDIHFDENGLPISLREGHGVGTRSIQAFAQKYNVLLDYSVENGWFRMMALLQGMTPARGVS